MDPAVGSEAVSLSVSLKVCVGIAKAYGSSDCRKNSVRYRVQRGRAGVETGTRYSGGGGQVKIFLVCGLRRYAGMSGRGYVRFVGFVRGAGLQSCSRVGGYLGRRLSGSGR